MKGLSRVIFTVCLPLVALRAIMNGAIGANDVIRAVANWTKDATNQIVNTFAWRVENMGTADQSVAIQYLLNTVENMYTGVLLGIADDVDTSDINLFNVTKNEPYGSTAWPTIVGGSAGGQSLPNQNAPYSFARTALNGVLGRKYLPPTTEESQADGVLSGDGAAGNAAFIDNWTTAWTDVVTGMVLVPGVIRTVEGLAHNTLAPLISGVARSYMHTLRNRRPGVGS